MVQSARVLVDTWHWVQTMVMPFFLLSIFINKGLHIIKHIILLTFLYNSWHYSMESMWNIRKRGVGFKATQSSLGVSEDSKDIKDPKRSGKSQVKVYLELNL